MYKLVLFDLDGTLLDSDSMVVAEFSDLFKKYRPDYHPSIEHMMTFSGPALMDTMTNEFPDQDPEAMCIEFTKENPKYLEKYCKFYPYVKEMLDDLRRLGVHFAIVTNKERPQTDHCCSLFPLLSEFETIITSTDIDAIKPDPKGVFFAMEKYGITNKDEVIYVGDGQKDMETAINANIDFAFVKWSPRKLSDYKNVTCYISSFKDFTKEINLE